MSMFEQIDLTDAKLEKEFGVGCLVIKSGHLWPLSHFVWESSAKFVGVTFFTDAAEPWDDLGLMRIEVYKLPRAKSDFADRVDWYLQDRKSRAIRIRDGKRFEASMLHVKGLKTSDWEQDSFAVNKGSIIRFYQSKKFAIIFRFLASSGPMLDHPVFKRAVKNIKFNDELWERNPPNIIDSRPKAQRERESEMTDEQADEMWECVRLTSKRLKLTNDHHKSLSIIHKEIDKVRKKKSLDDDAASELAYELGYTVGQYFCWEFDWEWCNVTRRREESLVICNPNRGVSIDPVDWIFQILVDLSRTNNCLLTWNMIAADRLPPSRPYSYSRLG